MVSRPVRRGVTEKCSGNTEDLAGGLPVPGRPDASGASTKARLRLKRAGWSHAPGGPSPFTSEP